MKLKKYAVILLVLTASLVLSACNAGDKDDSVVLAKAGDMEITQNDVDKYMYIECLGYGMDPAEDFGEDLDYIRDLLLSDVVDIRLMEQYCKDNDIEILPEDWETQFDTFVESLKGQEGAEDYLKTYAITDKDLENYFHDNYVRMSFIQHLQDGMGDLDAKAKEYYDAHLEDYKTESGGFQSSHIVVAEEATAQEVLDKLAAGQTFEELAAEYGTDGTKSTGGSLGYYDVGGGLDATFEEAALALEIGQISGIVKTDFGYHIIRLDGRTEAGGTKPLEAVSETIKNTLLGEAFNEKMEELSKKYGVEYYEREDDGTEGEDKGDGSDADGQDGSDANPNGDGSGAGDGDGGQGAGDGNGSGGDGASE